MSADNFVGVRPNKDGMYSVFGYGCMSILDEDCLYLSGEQGEVVDARDKALLRAHELVREQYICEYGVVEMSPVPDEPCGRCYMCINQRKVIAGDVARCDGCHHPISTSEWTVMTSAGTFHSCCEPDRVERMNNAVMERVRLYG
jgi:hypothetical protein